MSLQLPVLYFFENQLNMVFLKKIRTFFWIVSGFAEKRKKIILASALIGVGAFLFITKILPILPSPKPTERIGRVGSYTLETLPREITGQISYGLTTILQNGLPAPMLASSWINTNEGKNYTFSLRENLYWQDGSLIKASDLKFPFADLEVDYPDDKTIEFKLKEPFAPFLTILDQPLFKKNFLGNGALKVRKIDKKGDHIEKIYLTGKDKNIVYKFYPTLDFAVQAFKLGEIDVLTDVYKNSFDDKWLAGLKVEKTTKKDQYLGLFLNLKDPFLGNKKIRQALAYATLKDMPLEKASSPISPNSWAYNNDVKKYDFDPKKARELLKSALNDNNEASQSAHKDNSEKSFKLKITATPALLVMAEKIRDSWKKTIDIEVEVDTTNYLSDNFQVLLIGQKIPADPDQYPLWHSTQSQNLTHYHSPKVDKILEDARRILDNDKRKELYYDFQRFLTEDVPVIFLYYPEVYKISRR